jgi:hypothetical protein
MHYHDCISKYITEIIIPVQRLARSLRRLRAETGRDMALLPGIPGAQHQHSAVRGAPASCGSIGG